MNFVVKYGLSDASTQTLPQNIFGDDITSVSLSSDEWWNIYGNKLFSYESNHNESLTSVDIHFNHNNNNNENPNKSGSLNENENSIHSLGKAINKEMCETTQVLKQERKRGRPPITDPIVKKLNKKRSQLKAAKAYRNKINNLSKTTEENLKEELVRNQVLNKEYLHLVKECTKLALKCKSFKSSFNLKDKKKFNKIFKKYY